MTTFVEVLSLLANTTFSFHLNNFVGASLENLLKIMKNVKFQPFLPTVNQDT